MANKKKRGEIEDEIEEEGSTLGGELEDEETEEAADEVAEEKKPGEEAVVFVNREKYARAAGILELVIGRRAPRDANEQERTEKFRTLLNYANVKPTDKKAHRYVYETLLGGLVRSPKEEQEAKKKADAMRSKNKKRAVQSDSEVRSAEE